MREEPSLPPALAHKDAEKLFSEEFRHDPAQVYERLRTLGPIAPVWLEPRVPGWVIVDYETLIQVSRDTDAWSHDSRRWVEWKNGRVPENSELLAMMGYRPNLLFADGDAHTRLRRAVSESLDRVDGRFVVTATHRIANQLIDRFATVGRADLISGYAEQLPLLLVNRMFGLADREGHRLLDLLARIWDGQDAERASRDMERLLGDLLKTKMRHPDQDVTTWLMDHHTGLSSEEIVQHLVVIIGAANTPTANLISNALRIVLTNQEMRNALASAVISAEDVVDQALWLDPPMQVYPFIYPKRDIHVGRFTIPAGAAVGMGLASANQSISKPQARNRAYSSFGAGPHRCPARNIAFQTSVTAIDALLKRLGDVRLAVPAETLTWRPSVFMRGLERLPVIFTPTPTPTIPETERACPVSSHPSSTRPATSTPRPTNSAPRGRWFRSFSRDSRRSRRTR